MKSVTEMSLLLLCAVASARAVELGGQTYSTDTTLPASNTWSGGSLRVDNNATLTLPAEAYVYYSAGGFNDSGSGYYGTIDILGTWQHTTAAQLQMGHYGQGMIRVGNGGVYRFTAGGEIKLYPDMYFQV